jgi:hypothetical protein
MSFAGATTHFRREEAECVEPPWLPRAYAGDAAITIAATIPAASVNFISLPPPRRSCVLRGRGAGSLREGGGHALAGADGRRPPHRTPQRVEGRGVEPRSSAPSQTRANVLEAVGKARRSGLATPISLLTFALIATSTWMPGAESWKHSKMTAASCGRKDPAAALAISYRSTRRSDGATSLNTYFFAF